MRDYKKEYLKYGASKQQKLDRAERNRLNAKARKEGRIKKGDGNDVAHVKGGTRIKTASENRGSKTDMPGDVRARGGNKYKRLKKSNNK
jgi:hypothetical protein